MVILLCKESTMPELTYELNVGITGRTHWFNLFGKQKEVDSFYAWGIKNGLH